MKSEIKEKDIFKKLALLIFFIVFFVGIFVYYSYSSFSKIEMENSFLPLNFENSKNKLSQISKEISSQNKDLANKLAAIKEAEEKGNKNLALSLIKEAESINEKIKGNTKNFSEELNNLENSLKDFKNPPLENFVSNAISLEKKLMEEFNDYTLLMEEFLKKLSLSISQPTKENKKIVQDYIILVNEKINLIKDLNSKFNASINNLTPKQ
jgi:hypothetical protein